MKDTLTFCISGKRVNLLDLTMEEAIDLCRQQILSRQSEEITLSVRNDKGKFIKLGTYVYDATQERRTQRNPADTRSVCYVEPAIPNITPKRGRISAFLD